MRSKTSLFFLALLWQGFVFSQSNPLIRYIPDHANMVITINARGLADKMAGGSFRQNPFYAEIMKKFGPDSSGSGGFTKPGGPGIDFSSDLLLVTVNDSSRKFFPISTHLFGRLQNEQSFHLMISALFQKDTVAVYGTNKMVFHENVAIAWNNEVFVLTSANKSRMDQDLPENSSPEAMQAILDKRKAEMIKSRRALCFSLLTPVNDNFFSTDPHFINMLHQPGDIKIWSTGHPSPGRALPAGANPFAILSKLKSFPQEARTAIVRFENGKIVIQSSIYFPDSIAAIYKKHAGTGLNTELVRHLPPGKLLALMLLSGNPATAAAMAANNKDVQHVLDSVRAALHLSPGLFSAAFKNNMMLAAVKPDVVDPADSITRKLGGIQFFLAVPVKDKAKLEELEMAIGRTWDSLQNGKGFSKKTKGFKPAIRYNENLFVVSLSPQAATAFLSSKATGDLPSWLQSYSDHPTLVSISTGELFSILQQKKLPGNPGTNDQYKDLLAQLSGMLTQIVSSGGNYENESLNSSTELIFADQSKNGLQQLLDMIMLLAMKGKPADTNIPGK